MSEPMIKGFGAIVAGDRHLIAPGPWTPYAGGLWVNPAGQLCARAMIRPTEAEAARILLDDINVRGTYLYKALKRLETRQAELLKHVER